ncbi:MAG: flagellar hook-associated protein FlgK [Clostridiaceae bacterium]|nr:flagellar hook-associated protein FlgK [Clostridiaceae bacterium]
MSATFHGLEIAKSGLTAAQIAVNIANQNIANAETEGYTRQSVVQTSVSAGLGPFQFALSGPVVGQGVTVTEIMQNRDAYLDVRYRNANSTYHAFSSSVSALESIRGVLDETDTDGLNVALADYYTALQDLSNNQQGTEYMSLLRSAGEKVTNVLNEYASQLGQIGEELNYDLSLSVDDANNLLSKINELNKNIAVSTVNGTDCNELKDQRNIYLDKLSEYMNISVTTGGTGMVSIKSGSTTLLDTGTGMQATLSVGTGTAGTVVLDESGNELSFSGGSFMGLLQSINGAGSYAGTGEETFQGVVYYQKALDDLASAFASTYNTLNAGSGDLFASSDGSGTITAGNICLSEDWKNDASFVDTSTGVPEKLRDAMNEKVSISSGFTGTFEEYASLLMGNVGLDASYYGDMASAKNSIVESIQDDREAVSGISIDEETVNTIKYQKAYQAAARVMTVLDEMLDTLINGMAV